MEGRKIPREKDPKRPMVDPDTIDSLLTVAPQVHPLLPVLVMLAWKTGHRLSSILALRWDDVDFEKRVIWFRGQHDKIGQTWEAPAHPDVLRTLRAFRAAQPAIGSALLFPHPKARRHPGKPVTRHLAAYWLNEAFRQGNLVKPVGSLWHAFRRVWATERKGLSLVDTAAAGGWRDTATLLMYQQSDMETMRAIVEYERPRATAKRKKQRG